MMTEICIGLAAVLAVLVVLAGVAVYSRMTTIEVVECDEEFTE